MRILSNKDTAISFFVKELEERVKKYSVPIIKEGYKGFNLCNLDDPLIYFTNETIESRYQAILNKVNRNERGLYPVVVIGVDSSSRLDSNQTRFSSTSTIILEGLNNSQNLIFKGKVIKSISNMQIAVFSRSRLIANNVSDAILMALFDKYIYLSDMILYKEGVPVAKVPNQIPLTILEHDNLEFSDTTEQEKGVVITACDLEFSLPNIILSQTDTTNIQTTSATISDCII